MKNTIIQKMHVSIIIFVLAILTTACVGNVDKRSLNLLIFNKLDCLDSKKFVCMKSEQVLRRIFNDSLDAGEKITKQYTLDVSIDTNISSLLILSSDITTRNMLLVTMKYNIRNISNGKMICAGVLRNTGSLQVADSPYTIFLSQEGMFEEVISESAKMLRIRLLKCIN